MPFRDRRRERAVSPRVAVVAGYGDAGYEPMPAEGLADVSFDFATGMMAEAGCGDPVTLPLPVGTVVPPNPFCGSGFAATGDAAGPASSAAGSGGATAPLVGGKVPVSAL